MNAITKEIEQYTEDDYDQMLNEAYGDFMGYSASEILKSIDPIAYSVGFSDYQENEYFYVCGVCGSEFDNEDEANECCMEEEEEE